MATCVPKGLTSCPLSRVRPLGAMPPLTRSRSRCDAMSVLRVERPAGEVKIEAGAEHIVHNAAGADGGAAGQRGVQSLELDAPVIELDADIGREQPLHAGADVPAG